MSDKLRPEGCLLPAAEGEREASDSAATPFYDDLLDLERERAEDDAYLADLLADQHGRPTRWG